jgi:nitrite reductase/ring-hydroxylating ferredoxin subunit
MADADHPGRHHVVSEAELAGTDRVVADVEGREIAVFNLDGEYHAVANYCVHQGGPACEGLLSGTVSVSEGMELSYEQEGEIVACPWHGWEFDVRTGEHLARPQYRLPTYDVVTEDGEVYVEL